MQVSSYRMRELYVHVGLRMHEFAKDQDAVSLQQEQPSGDRGVGVGGVIREERVDLLRRGRQPGQVEGDPPEERVPIGLGRGLEPRRLRASP